MAARWLIQNGDVVTPDGVQRRDISVHGGAIEALSDPGEHWDTGAFEHVVDATGLTVLPGAIDVHVHFRTPGGTHKEDWGTASRAALAGGVTTVLDMPNTDPPTIDLEALAAKRATVAEQAGVHYGFFMGATARNLEAAKAAENIAGLKVYMGSSTGGLLVYEDEPLNRIFAGFPGLIAVHAEDEQIIRENSLRFQKDADPTVHPDIRTVASARRATERAIAMARRHGSRLHLCHMSTAEELTIVRNMAADEGVNDLDLTCEVTPHHLVLNRKALEDMGTLAKMNPPLRDAADCDALWAGVADGSVTCVATDHAPHTLKEKADGYWGAPAGVPGVQHMLPILLNRVAQGKLSLERVAAVTASAPAARFGISGKGIIAPGYDADLTLVDTAKTRTVDRRDVVSKCGWTLFEGMPLTGWPVMTVLDGQVVYERGEFPTRVRGREVQFSR